MAVAQKYTASIRDFGLVRRGTIRKTSILARSLRRSGTPTTGTSPPVSRRSMSPRHPPQAALPRHPPR